MSIIVLKEKYLSQLADLNAEIDNLNNKKIKVLFEALGISMTDADLIKMIDWELIILTVPDKQMAVQMNKLSAYVPNLKFVVDAKPIFTLSQGEKKRRVWKDR
jgi:hypothetical protein